MIQADFSVFSLTSGPLYHYRLPTKLIGVEVGNNTGISIIKVMQHNGSYLVNHDQRTKRIFVTDFLWASALAENTI